jgi:hypothetical protein
MGLFDGLFGGGKKNHTTTTQSQYPPELEEAYKRIWDAALPGMEPWLNDPTVVIADRNEQQTVPTDMLFDAMQWTNGRRDLGDIAFQYMGAHGPGRNFSADAASYIGNRSGDVGANYASGAAGTAGMAGATMPIATHIEQISGNDALALGNPFREAMTRLAIENIEDDHRKSDATTAARAATRNAFGGSGEALGYANNDKKDDKRIDEAVTKTAYDSYGVGSNLAQQNANLVTQAQDRFINTVFGNANNDRQAYSTADALQNSYFNRGMMADQFDMNAMTTADSLETSYWNRARGNLQDDMDVLGTVQGLDRGYLGNLTGVGTTVYGMGNDRQMYDQTIADAPYTQFGRAQGTLPNYSAPQTSTQPVYNNTWGQIGGGLLTGGSLAGWW